MHGKNWARRSTSLPDFACGIFVTNAALINNPKEGAFDDTKWIAYDERVPEIGTKITVVIASCANTKPSPSP